MRTGFTVSATAHATLIVLAIVGIGMGRPIDATPVESIAVDLVPVSEFTNIRMGSLDSEIVDTETPSVVEDTKPAEIAQPTGNTAEDQPTPADNAKVTPAPTENTAPAPEAAAEPEPQPEEVAPTPIEQPDPAPEPEPTPTPVEPTPEPTPVATPEETPDPADAAPKPAERNASLKQKREEFKKQQEAQKQKVAEEKAAADAKKKADEAKKKKAAEDAEKKRIETAKAAEQKKLADEVANIINNEDSRGATTGAGGEPTLGKETGRAATLSQSEIGALVAAIRSCITLPAGAEDADARAEFTFTIGADGMVVGQPQMNSQPSSQIEDAYARAVSRALQRCGPFSMAAGQDVRAQFAAREF
jgi:colicin import membrane protein